MLKILIYGVNGYIGSNLKLYLEKDNVKIIYSNYSKIENDKQILDDINRLKPDRIISCIGLVKFNDDNNIVYSTSFLNKSDFLKDNLNTNLYIHILLSNICKKNKIHFTYIGTGCIYSCNNSNHSFDEEDEPNFDTNNYSLVKGLTDKILSLDKEEILIIRLRQCINNDSSQQNFLVKFLNFETISNVQNSYTVIPSIFPLISKLIINAKTGKFNCVNKNTTSVKDIVELFGKKKYRLYDDEEMYKNYSNNQLSVNKLNKIYRVETIQQALINLKENWQYKYNEY